MFIAIGAINWLDIARIVRGQTLSLRQREYVQSAHISGASAWQIIRRHIVPNLLGVVIVYITLTIPQVILVESFLSFLGLGIQEPMASLGALVSDGAQEMETHLWMLLFPALCLSVLLFCFNLIGDGLRDALDPRQRR
jgi:oligopeptide transport system permease protein